MTLQPVDDALERVIRAGEHLADLRQRLDTARKQQGDSISVEYAPNPPHSIQASVFTKTFVSMRVGILIGEICYNLRSALDYLIYDLAEHDAGIRQESTQFPIADTAEEFASSAKRRLRGINSAHRAAIEKLQPYKGCEWTKTLRDFSNTAKHRKFVN